MATHSSVLAWRIPGMGEPGGLPSQGWGRTESDTTHVTQQQQQQQEVLQVKSDAKFLLGFPGLKSPLKVHSEILYEKFQQNHLKDNKNVVNCYSCSTYVNNYVELIEA